MKILPKIPLAYEKEVLKKTKIIVCTHTTDIVYDFLKILTEIGANVEFMPVPYSCNYNTLEQIKKINNLSILNSDHNLIKSIETADIIIEDGFRISKIIYSKTPVLKDGLFAIEQTTNGIKNLKIMTKKRKMLIPVIDVANNKLKYEIENKLSTPEKIISVLIAKTGISIAKKIFS